MTAPSCAQAAATAPRLAAATGSFPRRASHATENTATHVFIKKHGTSNVGWRRNAGTLRESSDAPNAAHANVVKNVANPKAAKTRWPVEP